MRRARVMSLTRGTSLRAEHAGSPPRHPPPPPLCPADLLRHPPMPARGPRRGRLRPRTVRTVSWIEE